MQVNLTYRQYQIVRELTTDGADNETIARRLRVGIQTVRTHFAAVYRKTGTRDRTELAVMVLQGAITFTTGPRYAVPTPVVLAVEVPEAFAA